MIGNQLGSFAAGEDIEELASDVFVALWQAGRTLPVSYTHLDVYKRQLVRKNGRIAESGTFDALMARKGYFYALYTVCLLYTSCI